MVKRELENAKYAVHQDIGAITNLKEPEITLAAHACKATSAPDLDVGTHLLPIKHQMQPRRSRREEGKGGPTQSDTEGHIG